MWKRLFGFVLIVLVAGSLHAKPPKQDGCRTLLGKYIGNLFSRPFFFNNSQKRPLKKIGSQCTQPLEIALVAALRAEKIETQRVFEWLPDASPIARIIENGVSKFERRESNESGIVVIEYKIEHPEGEPSYIRVSRNLKFIAPTHTFVIATETGYEEIIYEAFVPAAENGIRQYSPNERFPKSFLHNN